MREQEIISKFEAMEKEITEIKQIIGLQNGNNKTLANSSRSKKKSVKEFILEKSPKDGVQSATCIAYYLENFEDKSILTSKEIQKCFRDAKLKTPPNVPDKVQKAISNGWVAKGDKRGEFYLTSTGEQIVEGGFKKNENH